MHDSIDARNRDVFNRDQTVSYYARRERGQGADGLTACERHLFDRHLRPGMDVLDLGVGAGRTTEYLSRLGGRYVGIDYAPAMVAMARSEHPGLEFAVGDAQDLSSYSDSSFDSVVFAYNGLDCLHPKKARSSCLDECHRVLRPGGVLVLSSHSPRAIVARPRDPDRHGLLHRMGARSVLTARQLARVPPTRPFISGAGYVRDTAHGGLDLFTATPTYVTRELRNAGFAYVDMLGCDYPAPSSKWPAPWSQWFVAWYYYVARRP